MNEDEIGCCGAYCKTCKAYKVEGGCKCCKTGYLDGSRDVNKIKCKIKRCCLVEKKLASCADCAGLENCAIVNEFYGKNSYKYGKYRESILFIRDYGCAAFLEQAENWTNAYGKLKQGDEKHEG